VRDFIHRGAMSQSPTDLLTTTPILFLTRWVTHFCAPVFMLTAGLGAYLYWRNGNRTKGQLSLFLLTRGLWLVALELTLMQLAYNFNLATANPIFSARALRSRRLHDYSCGAHLAAGAVASPRSAWPPLDCTISRTASARNRRVDAVASNRARSRSPAAPSSPHIRLVPWFAVMALGFCLGSVLSMPPERRQRFLLRTGIAMTIACLVIRLINIYGDPSRWSWQSTATFTVLSFLNTTKVPAVACVPADDAGTGFDRAVTVMIACRSRGRIR
jgi:uncharacterized membrane protein